MRWSLCFLRELKATTIAVAMACRRAISAGRTNLHEFLHRDWFSNDLIDMLPVEINAFVTNTDTTWPWDESMVLISTLPTEGTLRAGAALQVIALPHCLHLLLLLDRFPAIDLTPIIRYTSLQNLNSQGDMQIHGRHRFEVRPLLPQQVIRGILRIHWRSSARECVLLHVVFPSSSVHEDYNTGHILFCRMAPAHILHPHIP
jgi:hypothetical protein